MVFQMIDQLWPYIGEYVRKLLQETVEPQIRASLPSTFGSFKFSKIELGDIVRIATLVAAVLWYMTQTQCYMAQTLCYMTQSVAWHEHFVTLLKNCLSYLSLRFM